MIKLIASDMDGTLLNSNHKISEENIKAIKEAERKGIRFAIATGRDYESVKPVLNEYNLKCECIVMSGAEYRDINGSVLESIEIDNEDVKKIIEELHLVGLSCDILTDKGVYGSNKELYEKGLKERKEMLENTMSEEKLKEFEKQFRHLFNPKYVSDINTFTNENIKIYKVMAYSKDCELIEELKGKFNKNENIAVASTFSNDIEITHVNAQKGRIISKVIKKLNIEKDEVMVLGDSFNDYSMFTEFNNSFAMGNAIDEIKNIATYITDSNDNNGVAKAIYKMIK